MTERSDASIELILARVRQRLEPLMADQPTMFDADDARTDVPTEDTLATLPDRELARWIEHTLLRPDATASAFDRLCDEAVRYGFAAVCVNPDRVRQCAARLGAGPVRVIATVGFPLGATLPSIKAAEAQQALEAGARGIDMVLHLGRLKDGEHGVVRGDIAGVVRAAAPFPVRVIVEAGCLTTEELVTACLLAQVAGAAGVKTGTGMAPGDAATAKPEDVRIMRRVVGPRMTVKAAGGIAAAATARALLAAGADRLGASRSLAIIGVGGTGT